MAEKADGNYDPGGEGGGFGGSGGFDPGGGGGLNPNQGSGNIPVNENDPRYNDYIDKMNQQNRMGEPGPKDLDEADPNDPHKPGTLKHTVVAPPAPPIDHHAPLGTTKNPIVVPTKRGGQY